MSLSTIGVVDLKHELNEFFGGELSGLQAQASELVHQMIGLWIQSHFGALYDVVFGEGEATTTALHKGGCRFGDP